LGLDGTHSALVGEAVPVGITLQRHLAQRSAPYHCRGQGYRRFLSAKVGTAMHDSTLQGFVKGRHSGWFQQLRAASSPQHQEVFSTNWP